MTKGQNTAGTDARYNARSSLTSDAANFPLSVSVSSLTRLARRKKPLRQRGPSCAATAEREARTSHDGFWRTHQRKRTAPAVPHRRVLGRAEEQQLELVPAVAQAQRRRIVHARRGRARRTPRRV